MVKRSEINQILKDAKAVKVTDLFNIFVITFFIVCWKTETGQQLFISTYKRIIYKS